MLVLGLTGGIGSGKSTVASVFAAMGIPVFNSDAVTNQLYTEPELKVKMIEWFGPAVINDRGEVNRKYIASQVFGNPELLKKLTNELHPRTALAFQKWKNQFQCTYVIKESAILFEAGLEKQMDQIVSVIAPEKLRLERVMKRDSRSQEEIQNIMRLQCNDELRMNKSDFIIYNDEKQSVIKQVLNIYNNLSSIK